MSSFGGAIRPEFSVFEWGTAFEDPLPLYDYLLMFGRVIDGVTCPRLPKFLEGVQDWRLR